jgi:hypothetical protein
MKNIFNEEEPQKAKQKSNATRRYLGDTAQTSEHY